LNRSSHKETFSNNPPVNEIVEVISRHSIMSMGRINSCLMENCPC
jgi:hypothetical protein